MFYLGSCPAFLYHVIAGAGFPDAAHSRVTRLPRAADLSCRCTENAGGAENRRTY